MNMSQQEAVVFMSAIMRKFHLELTNEDDPKHWAVFDNDPDKRKGRSSLAVSLNARGGVHFKIHPVSV